MQRRTLFLILSAIVAAGAICSVLTKRHTRLAANRAVAPSSQSVPNFLQEVESRIRGGIGAVLQTDPQSTCPQISEVGPASPAATAGLLPGDIILKANGKSLAGMPFVDARDEIRGFAGTSVELTVQRIGAQSTTNIVIKRASVKKMQMQ